MYITIRKTKEPGRCWQGDGAAPPFGIKKGIIKRLKMPFFCYKHHRIALHQFLTIIYTPITPATLLTTFTMGRSLDPVWEFYYRIEQDVQSLGLKAKANSAHNNGWCKNCVRMKLVGPEMATWVPDDSVLAETGQIETARRYKGKGRCFRIAQENME